MEKQIHPRTAFALMNPESLDRLTSRCIDRSQLDEEDIAAMWRLYSHYYGGTEESLFRRDLDHKTNVFVCRDSSGRIEGFSTVEVGSHLVDGCETGILFSGDTIISDQYWNRNDLALSWIRFASEQKLLRPDRPLFWFLIVKGHRTYRYMSVFGKRYYPAHGWPTPLRMQQLMDVLARDRFGDAWCAEDGVLRFESSRGYLKPPWVDVPEVAQKREEVAFFMKKNPGFRQGDELVCLCEVDRPNMKPLTRRIYDGVARDIGSC